MLAVLPTGHGCKVRCLTCGQTGPERESTDLAWAALMRSRKGCGGGNPDATRDSKSYETTGKGNRDQRR